MTSIGLGAAQGALQVHQPQQSVLYPHVGHRHTACIRNISVPQRSQTPAPSDARFGSAGSDGGDLAGSGMGGIIDCAC